MKTAHSKTGRLHFVPRGRLGCLHGAIAAAGDHIGRCMECDAIVATPFTLHSASAALADA